MPCGVPVSAASFPPSKAHPKSIVVDGVSPDKDDMADDPTITFELKHGISSPEAGLPPKSLTRNSTLPDSLLLSVVSCT